MMIRKPGRSARASQPLMPGCESVAVPLTRLPLTSAPPPNQSKNRNTKRARPAIPATSSPVRSLDESKSASVDRCEGAPPGATRFTMGDSTTSGRQAAANPCRINRVRQQHRDRHRAHPAGNGGDRARDLDRGLEIDVADQPVIRSVRADVDDRGAGTDHVPGDELRLTGRSDQDLRSPADLTEIASAAVADGR